MVRWAKSPLEWAGIDPLPPELSLAPMKIHWNQGNFHGWAQEFGGKRIDSGSLQWAFCSANHGWKSFLTLNSFPAHMRYFKNLKSTWHKNLSCSCQIQTIFWSLTPHLHVLIMIWNVYVSQKDGVVYRMSLRGNMIVLMFACWKIHDRETAEMWLQHNQQMFPIRDPNIPIVQLLYHQKI